jgi:hypothetical protein
MNTFHTLPSGDIVATGTNHRELNPFMNGDKVDRSAGREPAFPGSY